MMKPTLLAAVILCMWLVPCVSAKGEPTAIIVNKNSPLKELTWGELARIYKGRMTKWPNGKTIVATNRPVRSPIRKTFYKKVLGAKPTKQFLKPGSPIPFKTKRLKSDRATLKFIARVPHTIGYILLSAADKTVKILAIEGHLPQSKDYKLQ